MKLLYIFYFILFILQNTNCYRNLLFINVLNDISIYNLKKKINKISIYNTKKKNEINIIEEKKNIYNLNNINKNNIIKQYIYTLSHLSNFDIEKDKSIPLNILLLLKACLASHNYIKNVEIYTSNVLNKEICSFIYENSINFEKFMKLHILKYEEFFSNSNINETLKSYITDPKLYEDEIKIYELLNNENVQKKVNILQDILFECLRLNKMIQYSLSIDKLNMFSWTITAKIFKYFKSNGVYYDILIHSINKIKYFYDIQNIKNEDKQKINNIINNYLFIFNYMNDIYEQ